LERYENGILGGRSVGGQAALGGHWLTREKKEEKEKKKTKNAGEKQFSGRVSSL